MIRNHILLYLAIIAVLFGLAFIFANWNSEGAQRAPQSVAEEEPEFR